MEENPDGGEDASLSEISNEGHQPIDDNDPADAAMQTGADVSKDVCFDDDNRELHGGGDLSEESSAKDLADKYHNSTDASASGTSDDEHGSPECEDYIDDPSPLQKKVIDDHNIECCDVAQHWLDGFAKTVAISAKRGVHSDNSFTPQKYHQHIINARARSIHRAFASSFRTAVKKRKKEYNSQHQKTVPEDQVAEWERTVKAKVETDRDMLLKVDYDIVTIDAVQKVGPDLFELLWKRKTPLRPRIVHILGEEFRSGGCAKIPPAS